MDSLEQLRQVVQQDELLWISGGRSMRTLVQQVPDLREHTGLLLTDERVVSLDHPYRNERALAELGISVRGWGSHPRVGARPSGTPQYAILAVGPDGHVASCFPGMEGMWGQVEACYVPQAPLEPFVSRVTITPVVLAACARVFLVAVGESRHEALGHCVYRHENRADVLL